MIWEHFKAPVRIVSGYRCEPFSDQISGTKKRLHSKGKAANIFVEGIDLTELFKFAESIQELKGIGIYPEEKFIHVDTRDGNREEWTKEGGKYIPLTHEKRRHLGLI